MSGCGNHGCFIEEPKGQGTNGRCNCLRHLGKENEQALKRKLHRLRMLEAAMLIISQGKADWDNATPEMERDGMRLMAQIALEA